MMAVYRALSALEALCDYALYKSTFTLHYITLHYIASVQLIWFVSQQCKCNMHCQFFRVFGLRRHNVQPCRCRLWAAAVAAAAKFYFITYQHRRPLFLRRPLWLFAVLQLRNTLTYLLTMSCQIFLIKYVLLFLFVPVQSRLNILSRFFSYERQMRDCNQRQSCTPEMVIPASIIW